MKFYIYISDSKVDMLLSQIPHEQKRKIATEFKFDLKVLSASRKSEVETEDNRVARLETVIAFIHEYGNIGSVDDPNEYVEDELLMRWGSYEYPESPLIYFAGETEQTVVGLAGSKNHVIGNSMGESYSRSASNAPNILFYLQKELGLASKKSEEQSYKRVQNLWEDQQSDAYLYSVYSASKGTWGPEQRLEFVAKRLLYGNYSKLAWYEERNPKILLATPLYVAMVE